MKNSLKTSQRLSSVKNIAVDWAQSFIPRAPQPHIRAECADPQVIMPAEAMDYARKLSQEAKTYYYSDYKGVLRLRQAVAHHLAKVHGLNYDPDTEIIITTGCTEANFLAVYSCVDPGGRIMVLNPSYANFRTYSEVTGVEPVYVRTDSENHWEVDQEDLRTKCIRHSPSAIILGVPNNPTGCILSSQSYHAISEVSRSHDMWVIYDTVFDQTAFAPDRLPRFSDMKERMFVTGGTSKVFGLTGCRVGWLAGPREAITKIVKSLKLGTSVTANTFGQEFSAFMLEEGKHWIDSWVKGWKKKAEQLMDGLARLPVHFCPPDGGYFLFVDFRNVEVNSYAFTEYLIMRHGIFTAPGADYGSLGEGYLRIVYAPLQESEIRRLLQLLGSAVEHYPD